MSNKSRQASAQHNLFPFVGVYWEILLRKHKYLYLLGGGRWFISLSQKKVLLSSSHIVSKKTLTRHLYPNKMYRWLAKWIHLHLPHPLRYHIPIWFLSIVPSSFLAQKQIPKYFLLSAIHFIRATPLCGGVCYVGRKKYIRHCAFARRVIELSMWWKLTKACLSK